MAVWTRETEIWGIFELEAEGPAESGSENVASAGGEDFTPGYGKEECPEWRTTENPFLEAPFRAVFRNAGHQAEADGFYDGGGTYRIRFMPDMPGEWSFRTESRRGRLDGLNGTFACLPATGANHGPVRVRNTYHFAYEDGTPYLPFGTTCYAWTHQGGALEEQTLKTLAASPFNKMRMCLFPKWYDFNHVEPGFFPFMGSTASGFDFKRFNPDYFHHLERRILDLMKLGIEADLILFHPYDRWGFAEMDAETDDRYLRHVIARLSAFRNVWWSFANEHDLMRKKTVDDWERLAGIAVEKDPVGHLRSIHNCIAFYDHGRPWITHCSVQRLDVYKTAEMTNEWRERWHKPVVIDECAYEGNINHGWGNIPGFELTRRFWEGYVRGGYVGHGETYLSEDEVLWWSKGGNLKGTSPERIAFLRTIAEEGPGKGVSPIPNRSGMDWDVPVGGLEGECHLYYFGFYQPSFRIFTLNPEWTFKVDVIDTWNMTVEEQPGTFSGTFRIDMPGRQYMAVRMRRM